MLIHMHTNNLKQDHYVTFLDSQEYLHEDIYSWIRVENQLMQWEIKGM